MANPNDPFSVFPKVPTANIGDPFFYLAKSSGKPKPWGKLSAREQQRRTKALRTVNPELSDRQARKVLSDASRRGEVPKFGAHGNNEQTARSIVYQDRAERSREAYRQRGIAIKAIVNDHGTPRVVDVYGASKTERANIARHWNYVRAYIDGRRDVDYLEDRMKHFDGKRAGIVGRDKWRLETQPEGFELLAFRRELPLSFESIYVESGTWVDAA